METQNSKFDWLQERVTLREQFIKELETELSVLIDKHNKQFNKIDQEITLRINITPITKYND